MNLTKILNFLPAWLRRHKLVQGLLFIFPGSNIQLVEFNQSAHLWANISDTNARNYFIKKSFEPEFFAIAKPFLVKGGVFFDIGCNAGFCSFGLMGCIPNQSVDYHLFEANKAVCDLLQLSARLHPDQRININPRCVTDRKGMSRLKIFKSTSDQSFIAKEGEQEIKNLVLDTYIHENSISKINFMKIDVEGWEPFVLKGALRSLSRGVVEVIYMELISENLSRAGFSPKEYLKILEEQHFSLFWCRKRDLNSSNIPKEKQLNLEVNGFSMALAKIEDLPKNFHTDVLAIHKGASFLKSSPHFLS